MLLVPNIIALFTNIYCRHTYIYVSRLLCFLFCSEVFCIEIIFTYESIKCFRFLRNNFTICNIDKQALIFPTSLGIGAQSSLWSKNWRPEMKIWDKGDRGWAVNDMCLQTCYSHGGEGASEGAQRRPGRPLGGNTSSRSLQWGPSPYLRTPEMILCFN